MQGEGDEIIRQIKTELERIKKEKPESWEDINTIILNNCADGRLEKFLDNGTTQTVAEYVQRIERFYDEYHEYLETLDAEEPEVWSLLLQKLGKWAYNFLARKGVPEEVGRYQIAVDCAHEAGSRYFQYPYDVGFDRWACIVTHYVCLNYIRKHTDKLDYADYDLSETAEWITELSNPSDTSRSDARLDLLQAIGQLNSEDRQTFIIMHYFEGKDFDEIAVALGRSKNAVYKLHFDALENLRKIFRERGDNSE